MVRDSADRNMFVVMVEGSWWVTCYVHEKRGQGRSARRSLVGAYHVPDVTQEDPIGVLTGLAAQMALPPSERWRPRP